MLAVRHGTALKRLCVKCIINGKDVLNNVVADGRSLRGVKMVRKSLLEVPGSSLVSI